MNITTSDSARFPNTLRCLAAIVPLGVMALLIAGCGDMLTYAQDSEATGIKNYNDGHYTEAAGAFRNSIRQDPSNPETYYWLGLSYEATQQNHQAIDSYKTGIRLMPHPGGVRYSADLKEKMSDRLARVIAVSDTTHTETDLLIKSTEQTPTAEQYRLLGRIFRYRGDADTAITEYQHAVRLDPEDFLSQKELGLYLEDMNMNQQAGDVLRDAYRLNQFDQQVNDGLRKIGLIPGPSLLAQTQLPRPIDASSQSAGVGN